MLNPSSYRGLCRLAVFAAGVVGLWPSVLSKWAAGAFTLRGHVLRWKQEIALARGVPMETVLKMAKDQHA